MTEQTFYQTSLATIDSRERDEEIISLLTEAGWRIETLDSGDYRSINLAVEHKADDFVSSMLNGTLQRQLEEISDAKISLLIVSRSFEDIIQQTYYRKGLSTKHIYGFVARLICSGFVPLFMGDSIHTANLLKTVAVKAYDETGELQYRVSRLPDVPQPMRTYIGMGLSLARAKKLAEKYPTVVELVRDLRATAEYNDKLFNTKKEWRAHKWNAGTGIGEKGAKKIEELCAGL